MPKLIPQHCQHIHSGIHWQTRHQVAQELLKSSVFFWSQSHAGTAGLIWTPAMGGSRTTNGLMICLPHWHLLWGVPFCWGINLHTDVPTRHCWIDWAKQSYPSTNMMMSPINEDNWWWHQCCNKNGVNGYHHPLTSTSRKRNCFCSAQKHVQSVAKMKWTTGVGWHETMCGHLSFLPYNNVISQVLLNPTEGICCLHLRNTTHLDTSSTFWKRTIKAPKKKTSSHFNMLNEGKKFSFYVVSFHHLQWKQPTDVLYSSGFSCPLSSSTQPH